MAPRTETRLGVCNLCEAICGLELTLDRRPGHRRPGQPRRPAVARAHLPQGRRDRRRLRRPRPAAAPRATGGDPATGEVLAADRLGRGASTWSPTGWPATINDHGRDALGIYLGNPNVHSLGSHDPRRRAGQGASAPATRSAPRRSTSCRTSSRLLMFGHQLLLPIPDLDRTSYFLVFGGNPMASNGSLMTAPDFPNRLRAIEERGGQMVVVDPRRTETAKVADRAPASSARAPTRSCCSRCCNVLFADGARPRRRVVRDGAGARASRDRRLHARARGASTAASPPTTSAGSRASSPPPSGRRPTAAWASPRRSSARVCHWAVNLLNVVTGNLDREGGAMFTSPAVDVVGTGTDRARPPRRAGGAGCAGCPSSAASCRCRCCARRSRRRARARSGRWSRSPATRCCRRPTARGSTAALERPRLHGRRRHLRQRDHPARRRDPAADDRARARPLRPGVPRPRGAQHRPVHAGGVRRRSREPGTTGRSTASSRCARPPGCARRSR